MFTSHLSLFAFSALILDLSRFSC